MKKNLKLLSLFALALTVLFSSCGPDDPTPREQKLEDLKGTWNITGANVLDEGLTGVSITFTAENTTYTVSGLQSFTDANLNHDASLAADGTFELNEALDVVSLNPGGDFTITALNKDNGNATLSYSAPFPKGSDEETNITLNLVFAN